MEEDDDIKEDKLVSFIRKKVQKIDSSGTIIELRELTVQNENLIECKTIFDELWKGDKK